MVKFWYGPVAQWIERLRPKEKVVRSTRDWATKFGFVVVPRVRRGIFCALAA